jgi:hypothetical protein
MRSVIFAGWLRFKFSIPLVKGKKSDMVTVTLGYKNAILQRILEKLLSRRPLLRIDLHDLFDKEYTCFWNTNIMRF